MRWKVKVLKPLGENETRIIRKFLFLPKRIGDEWRWLEWAAILQVSVIKYDTYGLGAIASLDWEDRVWED